MPPRRDRARLFAGLLAIALSTMLARADARDSGEVDLPPPAPPNWLLVPQIDVAGGYPAFLGSEIGGGVQFRPTNFAFGAFGALTMSATNGPSACESALFCLHRRERFGLTTEYHFASASPDERWVGLDLELQRATGTSTTTYTDETRWGVSVAPKVGVDFVGRWPRGLAGIGVFIAVPIGGVTGVNRIGITLGVRAPFGFF